MKENRLIHEKSPYLLQHSHNPVDWFPWGREVFDAARALDRPVFLSIGYSTCHWCHVMERESFEKEEAARILNRAFVSVKVDREERPDVDAVYMEVCQMLTGSGGWPLTILMTPDQKPFWAGTYLPLHARYGQPGLLELLGRVELLWNTERKKLLRAGEEIVSRLAGGTGVAGRPCRELFREAYEALRRRYDPENGGFGEAPKFPAPHSLLFLLEYAGREKEAEAGKMAETTLIQMGRGGIFDQIGGGFSRYSTDDRWLVPHFEKMLYDNALLIIAYLEAYARTGGGCFRSIAEQTLEYVLRELQSPEGGFFCAQDADSDGEEGKFYLLTPDEVREVLGPEDGGMFCERYDITSRGNCEGKSIPNLLSDPNYPDACAKFGGQRRQLYAYRSTRTSLHRDDKILTSWNALMISALAKAYLILGNAEALAAARRAWDFVGGNLMDGAGRLFVRWREGEAAHAGHLDDYAFLALALLELYEAGFDSAHLHAAVRLAGVMERRFWDEKNGGFYLTADDAETLISRPKEAYDGAMPSGNSAAGMLLDKLWKLTGDTRWRKLADRQLSFLAGSAKEYPAGHSFALLAMMRALEPSRELVCVSRSGAPPDGLAGLSRKHRLHTLLKTPSNQEQLGSVAPFTAAYPIPETGFAYYLCRNGSCAAPVFDLGALKAML